MRCCTLSSSFHGRGRGKLSQLRTNPVNNPILQPDRVYRNAVESGRFQSAEMMTMIANMANDFNLDDYGVGDITKSIDQTHLMDSHAP